jgi:GNAT superfamily N-acetyltransferase
LLDVDYASHPNMTTYEGKILIHSDDEFDHFDMDEVEIGTICLEMYDLNFEAEHCSLMDAFDHSSSSHAVGTAILDDSYSAINDQILELVGDSFNMNILLVNRLEINEKYRAKGYGKYVLNSLDIYFKSTCAYVVLKSFPLGFEGITNDKNYKKAQERLNSFYSRCGYKKIAQAAENNTEEDEFDEDIEYVQDDEINHIFVKNIASM